MNKKKAFTLMELLVVVIVLGVLGAVAAPKLSRVLETRRTAEAEEMLSALRTEQEKRCILGKNYTADFSKIPVISAAARSKSYTYELKETGAEASRGEYTLKMPSYKDGRMCCEGDGCAKLNKNYIACNAIPADDECKAQDMPCTDCSCTAYAAEHGCECSPSTETCCSGGQVWNETSKVCEDLCTDCSCTAYATAHACECSPSTETCCSGGQIWNETSKTCENPCTDCSCTAYAAEHACECSPSTETCCSGGQVWNDATKSCEDQCQDAYDYIGLAGEEESDTCDGDRSGKYTCDGKFKGTCTDVYESALSVRTLSAWVPDSFFGLPEPLLLASGVEACKQFGKGATPCGKTTSGGYYCCPSGYYCDMSGHASGDPYGRGTCKKGTAGGGDIQLDDEYERACEGGKVWDKTLKDCVCPLGMSWDEEKQECGFSQADIAVAVYKRTVTCCGS